MLILLPPSEGKSDVRRGRPLDLATLGYPTLTESRRRVLDALVELCRGDPEHARQVLGLTPGQQPEVGRDAALLTAPTAPAGRIYSGVLYDALDLRALSATAKRRAAARVAVTSALFGLLRLGDRIPAYRLGGAVSLPGLGTVAGQWRAPLAEVLTAESTRGLVVDLRSATYSAFWRPDPRGDANLVVVRVLHEVAGVRSVVSHFNKATKGRLVAQLLEDGANPRRRPALADVLRRLGWQVEESTELPRTLDVVVGAL